MAALQTLRNKGGIVITVIIAVALLSFILTDLLGQNSIFNNSDVIGEIDGQTVKVQDYQQKVDQFETFTKMNQGSMSLTEDVQNQIREQVWRQMVQEVAYNKVFENAGIDVTGDEIYDMAAGNHISPALRPLFTNQQTGMYDRSIAENFLRNKNLNAESAFYWMFIENNIKSDRMQNKYMTLLRKSIFCTDAQAKLEAEKRAKEVDLAYVSVRYTNIADSLVNVAESDIKARFKKNIDNYKVEASRDVEYVSFPIKPSEFDNEETLKLVEELKADFASAETDAFRFAQNNAETPALERYMTKAQLPSVLASFVETAKPGEVYGPYREGDAYKISRLVAVAQRPDSVKASHILIRNNSVLADSLFGALKKGGDFAAAARQYSEDNGSAINGGDLDWFSDGMMVPTFNEACFTGNVGDIVKVESDYGTHIIKITGKGVLNTKYSVATIDKTVQYSSRTQQEVYAQANVFAANAKNQESFNTMVDSLNLVKRYGNSIRQNAQSVNSLRQARELVKWAFKAEVGEVSDIFQINDEFVLAVLVKQQEKGTAAIADVAPMLTRELRNEKKAQLISSEVSGKSLAEVAEKYNAKVDTAHHVSFASNAISGAGSEPALVGAAVAAQQGSKIAALKGNNAVYVAEVANVTNSEANIEAAKAAYMQKFQSLEYQVNAVVTDIEVDDNRIKFY